MHDKINIPDTELHVSRLGLGTVDAGVTWGRDVASADSMFGAFTEAGGNLIDCAHVYSDWVAVDGIHEVARCERVTGEWMKRHRNRDEIVLMTKGGHPVFTNVHYDLHLNRCTKADMRGDLEGSLEILQTDYIDIYNYHRDDPSIPAEEMVETMQDFVRAGKIRYFGVSNWSADRQRAAMEYSAKMGYRGAVADQSLLNVGVKNMNPLADDTLVVCKDDLYDYHQENLDTILMPFMANASGFFHIFAAKGEEGVANSPYATEANLAIARKVVDLSAKYDCAITNVVLGYFAFEAFPCVPLYGPFNEESIKEAMRTFEIQFDSADFQF